MFDDVIKRIGYANPVQQNIGAVALTVIVNRQYPFTHLAQPMRQVHNRCRFSTPPLVIDHADNYTRHNKYHL
jgi:hypothetical protein